MCAYETHVTYPQKFFMICVQTPSCITVYTKKENISFFYLEVVYNQLSLKIISKLFWRGTIT